MNRCVDNLDDKKISAIMQQMLIDYDDLYTQLGKLTHGLEEKNQVIQNSMKKMNKIMCYDSCEKKFFLEAEKKNLEVHQDQMSFLVDELKDRKKAIISLKAENKKQQFEIQNLIESKMSTHVVESR